jgi:gliding motility-associated-like protein
MKHFLNFSLLLFGLLGFLTIPDAHAQCPTQASVTLKTHTDITCFGANDGTITVDLADASTSEPYNFELYDLALGSFVTLTVTEVEDKVAKSVVYSNVPPSSYAVVFIKTGCPTLQITETPFGTVVNEPAQLSVTSTVQPDCDPSPTGTGQIDITISGGTAPFTIIWTGPTAIPDGTTSTAANLNAGTYNVNITDNNGCNITQDIVVAVSTQADAGPATGLTCGTNSFVLSGNTPGAGEIGTWTGPAGVTFSPNANDPNATANNLAVGDNTLTWTITDVGMVCPGTSDNIVVTYSNIAVSTSGDILLNCNGDANGAGSFTRSGGTGGYTWTLITNTAGATFTAPGLGDPSANKPFTGASAGVITLQALDNSGCTAQATITITQPPALTFTTTKTDVSCFGGNDGSITVTASGGTGPYEFSSNNGGTFTAGANPFTFTTLTAGTYNIVVRDANLCTSTATAVTINQPASAVTITSTSKTDATCLGVNDGSIQVNSVSGGTPGYQYSIDGGANFQASNNFAGLAPADYDVVARDTRGCVSAIVTVTVASGVSFTPSTSKTDATCDGVNDGVIQINSVSGGTAPYTYSIDGGLNFQASNIFNGLAPGDYDVIARDNNGCISATVVVTIGSGLVFDPTATPTDASCSGVSDGQIVVTGTTGGTAPFSYSNNGGVTFQASDTFTGLAAGSYDVVVRDNNGCLSTTLAVVIGTGLSFDPTATPTDASCSGVNDGSIVVTGTTGGTAPFEYSVDGGANFQVSDTFTGLASGNYDVVVRDANTCLSTTLVVAVGVGLSFDPTANSSAASCSGASDGSIVITGTTGGTAPFEYSIDGGANFQASDTFTGLVSGNYNVVVRDANTCISTTLVVNVGSALTITTSVGKTDASCLGNDGSITVNSVSGGTGPYEYSINNGSTYQTSNTFAPVSVGNYQVVVRDANGCLSGVTPISINLPSGCAGANCFAFTLTVDPALTKRPTCNNQNDGAIVLNVSGSVSGNYIIQLLKPSDPSFTALSQVGPSGTYTFNGLSPGNYEYRVQDQAGNVCQQPYSLPVESTVDADASGFVDATCYGQPTGRATITVLSGGNAPYEYSLDGTTWVSFTSPHTVTNLPPNGTYSILVRNNSTDQCPDQVSVTINNVNPAITASFSETAATCGNNDGSITITSGPSGGSGGPYTFKVDNVDATAPFTNLSGGNHVVTITDGAGCSQDFTRFVPYPDFIQVAGISSTDASCGTKGNISILIDNYLPAVQYEVAFSNDLFDVPTQYFTQYYLGNGLIVINGLSKGDYFVWIRTGAGQCPTIANNIQNNDPIVIGGPYALSFEIGCRSANGDLQLRNVSGAPGIQFGFEIDNLNGFGNTGTFTPNALGSAVISGFSVGQYVVKIFQDQSSIGGCVNEETAFVPAPLAALDTVFVRVPNPISKLEKSFPENGTASRLVRIQESGSVPYEIMLELTNPFGEEDPNPVKGWFPVTNREYRFDNLYAGIYTLSLSDGYGCIKTYQITVPLDDRIWIPNIFTPNNDGYNDTFQVRNLPDNAKLIVSNRWGKQVFASDNYRGDWNGGSEADGVYYYRLQAGSQVYTGWVEILRGKKP